MLSEQQLKETIILYFGDQLTATGIRSVQGARTDGDDSTDWWSYFVSIAADFHARMLLIDVCIFFFEINSLLIPFFSCVC